VGGGGGGKAGWWGGGGGGGGLGWGGAVANWRSGREGAGVGSDRVKQEWVCKTIAEVWGRKGGNIGKCDERQGGEGGIGEGGWVGRYQGQVNGKEQLRATVGTLAGGGGWELGGGGEKRGWKREIKERWVGGAGRGG